MKLDFSNITTLSFPLEKAITTNKGSFNTIDCIALDLISKPGNVGKSAIRGLGPMPCSTVKKAIKEIIATLTQQNAIANQNQWNQFWHLYRPNRTKEEIYALAAVDIAVWDLFLKTKKKPLHQLLNQTINQKILVYGTTGWLSLSEEKLIDECKKYAAIGVNAFKIRLGHPNDYERVKAIRHELGENYTLMLDANQRYQVQEAIQVAKKMADLNIHWLEEPVGNNVKDSLAVTKNSPIPIAIGENVFTEKNFSVICKIKAAKILQPDIIRCGGITGFFEIAKVTAEHQLPLCNHLLPELSVSALSNFSNSYYLEYDDLLPPNIFTHRFSIENGYILPPLAPGTGVELTEEAINAFSTSKENVYV